MKLKLLAILTIILILASMSCKKKDDDTSPTAPKTTLSQRAGTYTCTMTMIDSSVDTMEMIIGVDGSIKIANQSFTTPGPESTETVFNIEVITSSSLKGKYEVNFDTKKLTGKANSIVGLVYSFTKN